MAPSHTHSLEEQLYDFNKGDQGSRKGLVATLLATSLLILGLILHCVATFTPQFAHFLNPHTAQGYLYGKTNAGIYSDLRFGLWEVCWSITEPKLEKCVDWSTGMDDHEAVKAPGWIIGGQVVAILGILVTFATLVSLFLQTRHRRWGFQAKYTCSGSLLAGILVFVSDIIVASSFHQVPYLATTSSVFILDPSAFDLHISWGFALDIVAVVCLWVSGPMAVLGRRKEPASEEVLSMS